MVGSTCGFRFVEQSVFDNLVVTSALVPGFFYYTSDTIYLANTKNTFYTYSGASVQAVVEGLLADEKFKKRVIDEVSESDKLVQDIINDPRLRERIAKDILDSHPTFIQDILNLLVESTALHMLIVDAALSTPTFIDAVANLIVGNQTFIDEIKNAILNDSTLIQNLANQILDTISSLSMVDPEGNSIAEKDGGTFKFQAADHEQYGIVKGEANDSPSTWHLVSFINGLGSINREGLIDFIKTEIQNAGGVGGGGITYQDVIKILNQITLLGPDGLPIATNVEGMITVQQATPQQYGVVKPRKNSQLYPQAMSWYTMNRTLEADVKNDVHMFAPFAFPKCMPKRIEFFDKLTFIPINVEPDCGMSCKCCHNPNT